MAPSSRFFLGALAFLALLPCFVALLCLPAYHAARRLNRFIAEHRIDARVEVAGALLRLVTPRGVTIHEANAAGLDEIRARLRALIPS